MVTTFKRALSFVSLVAALSFASGCTSDDTKPADEVVAPEQAVPEAAKVDCTRPPEPVMCCQAMIPACDECREKSRREVEAWQKQCGGDSGASTPPSADIRGGVDCSAKPTLAQCCATAEPSCNACRKRVARLIEMQKKHCK